MSPQTLGYREIAASVRNEIVSGRYPTGSLLPPEPELAVTYGASRSLVNRALAVLASEGSVRPEQGHGTVVTWLPDLNLSAGYSQPWDGDAAIRALGLAPRHEITLERVEPPAEIAAALGMASGELCLVRRRRLLASGIPVKVEASWAALDVVGGAVVEVRERITPCRLPTEVETRALEIVPACAVTDIRQEGYTADGRVIEVVTTVTHQPLRCQYDFPLDAQAEES